MPETFSLADNKDTPAYRALFTLFARLMVSLPDEFEEHVKEYKSSKTAIIELKINGREFNFSDVIQKYAECFQDQVQREASDQLRDRLYIEMEGMWEGVRGVNAILQKVERQITDKAKQIFPNFQED